MKKLFKFLMLQITIIVICFSAYTTSFSQCSSYCWAYTNNPYDEYIYGFEFYDTEYWNLYLSNWTWTQEEVADYTSWYYTMYVNAGKSYYVYVYNGNAWSSDQVRVFVDWNQDCDFDDYDETYVLYSYDYGNTFQGYIDVPMSAKAGDTRMRVRMTYASTPSPCDESSFGEIEDYTINVTPGVTLSILPFEIKELCPGGSFPVSYEVTGDYNWGNTFTAILSDEFGNFSNPTVLGSIQSITSGTIDCQLQDSAHPSSNYMIKIDASSPSIENVSTELFTVYPKPIAYKVIGTGGYCIDDTKGSPVQLNGSQVNTTYQLYFNGNPIGGPVMGTGNVIDFGYFTAEGNYTVSAISEYGCKNDMQNMFQVKKIPVPNVYSMSGGSLFYNEPGDGTYCEGEIGVAIGMVKSDEGVDYLLKLNGKDIITSVLGNGGDINFGYLTEEGTYTVSAVTRNGGCENNMNGSITVRKIPAPAKYNITSSGAYCEGEDGTEVKMEGSQSGVSYQLQLNDANLGDPIIGTGSSISFGKFTEAGIYKVIAQKPGLSCTTQMESEIKPHQIAKPIVYNIAGKEFFCAGTDGSELSLSKSEVNIMYQLKRDNNAVGTPIAGTGESISFGKQTIEGVYTIDAITTSGGCTNAMNGSINLNEIPNPEIQITGNMTPDFSSNESYVDANAAEGDRVEWSVSGGEIVGSNTGASINVDWGNNKTGKIRITKTNAYGCTTTKEIDINLINTITADFGVDKLKGEVPLEIRFTDKSTGYITYWNWEFGDGKMSPVKDPVHIYTVPGKYFAKLTVGFDDIFISKILLDTIIVENKVGVNDEPIVNKGLSLSAIEPNPSSDVIRFNYGISTAQDITISIYNILGERVLTVSEGYQSEGTHSKEINISQLPSGAYYVQVLGNAGYVNRMINIVK